MTEGPIYIGNVKMSPLSTREEPYLFKDLVDAREFSRISGMVIWAGLVGSTSHMYSFRIYPGGRSEQWPKKLKKSSGTKRHSFGR